MLKSAVRFIFTLVLLVVFAASANAATVTYSGSTVDGPLWNRPLTSTLLSGVGTAVPYSVQAFEVDAAGLYDFLSTQTDFDGYLVLYSLSFDATHPLVIDDAGPFTNSINGDGEITLDDASDVPLPAALPLYAAGLAAMGYLGRRRKRARPLPSGKIS